MEAGRGYDAAGWSRPGIDSSMLEARGRWSTVVWTRSGGWSVSVVARRWWRARRRVVAQLFRAAVHGFMVSYFGNSRNLFLKPCLCFLSIDSIELAVNEWLACKT